MKYLVSVTPEAPGTDPSVWAPPGEPVVPWYPATDSNVFVSGVSFKPSPIAEVADIDLDPDALAVSLQREYPGLPLSMHQNYVFHTAMAAGKYPVGTKLRIWITPQTAKLQPVGTDELYTMWEQQPVK